MAPRLVFPPSMPFTLQLTDESGAPVTVAVNCCVCEVPRDTLDGATEMAIASSSVTTALSELAGAAALVAVTLTVCWVLIEEGAVYSPELLTLPTGGSSVQVTA